MVSDGGEDEGYFLGERYDRTRGQKGPTASAEEKVQIYVYDLRQYLSRDRTLEREHCGEGVSERNAINNRV